MSRFQKEKEKMTKASEEIYGRGEMQEEEKLKLGYICESPMWKLCFPSQERNIL